MNTIANLCNIKLTDEPTTSATFKEILTAWNNIDCIHTHKKIILQGHDKPSVVSVSRQKTVHGVQIDPNLYRQFQIQISAIKLNKADDTQCVILQITGPKGIIIPKGTMLAKLCYENTVFNNQNNINIIHEEINNTQQEPITNSTDYILNFPRYKSHREKVTATKHKKGYIKVVKQEPTEQMPLTQHSYTVHCSSNKQKLSALIDSGSCGTCISLKALNKISPLLKWDIQPSLVSFTAAQGSPLTVLGEITLDVDIDQWFGRITFIVIENLQEEIIIGQNFLTTHADEINFQTHNIKMRNGTKIKLQTQGKPVHIKQAVATLSETVVIPSKHVRRIKIYCPIELEENAPIYIEPLVNELLERGVMAPHMTTVVEPSKIITLEITNPTDKTIILKAKTAIAKIHPLIESNTNTLQTISGYKLTQIQPSIIHNNTNVDTTTNDDILNRQTHLTNEQKEAIYKIINKYPSITGKKGLGKTNITEHNINTGDATPQKASMYRQPETHHRIVQEEVQSMLEKGVIEKSSSPWNAPVILVKKPDGSWRFCVDYRKLNNATKKDCYPIPRIDETLDKLGKACIFTTIDLKSGYWQVKLAEKDKEKTAFSTRTGHYQFTVMPFGLCNAPSTFQRLMDLVLEEYRFQFCLVYLDDIIIYSKNFDEHLQHIENVFSQLDKARLTLNLQKCSFAKDYLNFLGHTISKDGILPCKEKIQAIERCQKPTCLSDVRSFLGLTNYYRRFVPMFSTIASPLHKLIKINSKFEWNQQAEESFNTLKQKLQSAPILRRPDYNLPFIIYTDASNVGVGAVLAQSVDSVEHVIAYCSRTLNKAEKNYSATEKECLAVVYAIKEFRPYVYGTSFTVVTDHQALTWLAKLDDTNPRLARWILLLSEYDFRILYRPGKANKNADGLSRLPQPSKENEQEDEIYTFSDMLNVQFKTEFSNKTINLINTSPSCVLGAIRRSTRIKRKPEIYGSHIPSEYIFSYNHPRTHKVVDDKMPNFCPDITNTTHKNNVPSRRGDIVEAKQPPKKKARHSEKSSFSVGVEQKLVEPIPDTVVQKPKNGSQPTSEEAKVSMLTNPHCEPEHDHEGITDDWLPSPTTVPELTGLRRQPDEQKDNKYTQTHNNDTSSLTSENKSDTEQNDDKPVHEQTISNKEKVISIAYSLENIRREQDLVPFWKGIKDYILTGEFPTDANLAAIIVASAPDYEVIDEILYYWPIKRLKNKGLVEKRIVIPKSLRINILKIHHDSLYGGHLGAPKTYARIQKKYFWVGMYKDTYEYCKTCETCQRAKRPRRELPVKTYKTYVGEPFERVQADFVGPLPLAEKYKYIIVFVCAFTKWAEAKAVEDCTAETACNALIELIVTRYGVPKEFLTNQGSSFTAYDMRQLTVLLGAHKLYTTAYHPQTNGQCERLNGSMIQMLRTYGENNPSNWSQYLPYILFAYRCSIHNSTGYTPFEMVYGRTPKLPGEEHLFPKEEESLSTYSKRVKSALEQIHKIARTRLIEAKEKHDTKELPSHLKKFKEGDKVLVRRMTAHKLEYAYEGPYDVVRVCPGEVYEIKKPHQGQPITKVNGQRLKLFNLRKEIK